MTVRPIHLRSSGPTTVSLLSGNIGILASQEPRLSSTNSSFKADGGLSLKGQV